MATAYRRHAPCRRARSQDRPRPGALRGRLDHARGRRRPTRLGAPRLARHPAPHGRTGGRVLPGPPELGPSVVRAARRRHGHCRAGHGGRRRRRRARPGPRRRPSDPDVRRHRAGTGDDPPAGRPNRPHGSARHRPGGLEARQRRRPPRRSAGSHRHTGGHRRGDSGRRSPRLRLVRACAGVGPARCPPRGGRMGCPRRGAHRQARLGRGLDSGPHHGAAMPSVGRPDRDHRRPVARAPHGLRRPRDGVDRRGAPLQPGHHPHHPRTPRRGHPLVRRGHGHHRPAPPRPLRRRPGRRALGPRQGGARRHPLVARHRAPGRPLRAAVDGSDRAGDAAARPGRGRRHGSCSPRPGAGRRGGGAASRLCRSAPSLAEPAGGAARTRRRPPGHGAGHGARVALRLAPRRRGPSLPRALGPSGRPRHPHPRRALPAHRAPGPRRHGRGVGGWRAGSKVAGPRRQRARSGQGPLPLRGGGSRCPRPPAHRARARHRHPRRRRRHPHGAARRHPLAGHAPRLPQPACRASDPHMAPGTAGARSGVGRPRRRPRTRPAPPRREARQRARAGDRHLARRLRARLGDGHRAPRLGHAGLHGPGALPAPHTGARGRPVQRRLHGLGAPHRGPAVHRSTEGRAAPARLCPPPPLRAPPAGPGRRRFLARRDARQGPRGPPPRRRCRCTPPACLERHRGHGRGGPGLPGRFGHLHHLCLGRGERGARPTDRRRPRRRGRDERRRTWGAAGGLEGRASPRCAGCDPRRTPAGRPRRARPGPPRPQGRAVATPRRRAPHRDGRHPRAIGPRR